MSLLFRPAWIFIATCLVFCTSISQCYCESTDAELLKIVGAWKKQLEWSGPEGMKIVWTESDEDSIVLKTTERVMDKGFYLRRVVSESKDRILDNRGFMNHEYSAHVAMKDGKWRIVDYFNTCDAKHLLHELDAPWRSALLVTRGDIPSLVLSNDLAMDSFEKDPNNGLCTIILKPDVKSENIAATQFKFIEIKCREQENFFPQSVHLVHKTNAYDLVCKYSNFQSIEKFSIPKKIEIEGEQESTHIALTFDVSTISPSIIDIDQCFLEFYGLKPMLNEPSKKEGYNAWIVVGLVSSCVIGLMGLRFFWAGRLK